tara:strand:- start:363 stop:674 length:312 start_codon:yes stop_codon:yes gene_type:complete
MMQIFIVSVFLLLSVSQVSGQIIYGPGNKPCSELVKAWEGGSFFDKNFFDAWVTGFVGGANWVSQQSLHADETVFGMSLLKFCKANLSEKVFEGAMHVYEKLN